MRDLLELASRVARHNTTVLITGESGTGKEVLAKAIHRMSSRHERSFIAINCAAIPEHLLESELFGHAKGAFTGAVADRMGLFEAAHEGTLLLDEIGDLPLGLQAKLLRVLEEGEVRRVGGREGKQVDVRVIAATAKELGQAVERGEFRSDLYYRLDVVRLHVPPLRERPDDVSALLAYFARQAAERTGHAVSITPQALATLTEYGWPGNVRELRNAVERAAVLAGPKALEPSDFSLGGGRSNGASKVATNGNYDLRTQVEEVERTVISRALEATKGNRREAAHLLGISLRTLFYKLRRTQTAS
jgi:two-component system, NtrC family, response regulator AtoC